MIESYIAIEGPIGVGKTSLAEIIADKLNTRKDIIVFDDYGNTGYPDTKIEIDEFFKNKPGVLMKSPTGQAIYYV